MQVWSKLIDVATIGSDSPLRRLVGYYLLLGAATALLLHLFPPLTLLFSGEHLEEMTGGTRMLEDGLLPNQLATPVIELPDRLGLAVVIATVLIGTVFLMLPVSWVYMSARRTKGYDQAIVQALIILPIVVAGIVFIVRNSLALAFSLAGIVAGVRFRNRLRDARDAVFIFLAIGVGLAAGVQALTVAALLSVIFNFVVLLVWRSDFGRAVLEPSPAAQWSEPLSLLAERNGVTKVPDRDLLLALTPRRADALAKRFERLRQLVGDGGRKKPRYDAVLWVTTDDIAAAQHRLEGVLERGARRWMLDEVVTNEGKPSEIYYLLKLRKSVDQDRLLTMVRAEAGDAVLTADLQFHEALLARQTG
ncbi:MAG TPA: DUF4956 domain-containing protein [Gemmatimonadales bacterium]|nr:DUF4956 domain-containing protein [Gemmatimonadales bacterium]